jgi:hypothetical protein
MPRVSKVASLRFAARLLGLGAVLGAGGCRTFDPKHPLVGAPDLSRPQPGYYLWIDEGRWHLRMTTAPGHARRFQGSVAGTNGGVVELTPTRPELKERIAVVGDAVQFDVEAAEGQSDGFDVKVAGGCARFDLYVDGRYRPERVRLGPRATAARHVPFERCP